MGRINNRQSQQNPTKNPEVHSQNTPSLEKQTAEEKKQPTRKYMTEVFLLHYILVNKFKMKPFFHLIYNYLVLHVVITTCRINKCFHNIAYILSCFSFSCVIHLVRNVIKLPAVFANLGLVCENLYIHESVFLVSSC